MLGLYVCFQIVFFFFFELPVCFVLKGSCFVYTACISARNLNTHTHNWLSTTTRCTVKKKTRAIGADAGPTVRANFKLRFLTAFYFILLWIGVASPLLFNLKC